MNTSIKLPTDHTHFISSSTTARNKRPAQHAYRAHRDARDDTTYDVHGRQRGAHRPGPWSACSGTLHSRGINQHGGARAFAPAENQIEAVHGRKGGDKGSRTKRGSSSLRPFYEAQGAAPLVSRAAAANESPIGAIAPLGEPAEESGARDPPRRGKERAARINDRTRAFRNGLGRRPKGGHRRLGPASRGTAAAAAHRRTLLPGACRRDPPFNG